MNGQNPQDDGIEGNWRSGHKSSPPEMERVFEEIRDKENHVALPTLSQQTQTLLGRERNSSADRRSGWISVGGFVKGSGGRSRKTYQSYKRNPPHVDKHDWRCFEKRKTYVEKRVGDVKDESRDEVERTMRSSSKFESNLERLTKWLKKTPEEVLLAIGHPENTWWRQLVNSEELLEDELIAALQVLGEKICVDVPFLLEEQASVVTDSCSKNFIRKLVDLASKIPSGLSLSNANKKFAVDTTPQKVITNIYELCYFVMKILPNTGVDIFKELVMTSIAVSTLHDPCLEMVGKFKALADQMKEMTMKEQRKEDTKIRQKWFGFNEQDMAEFDSETPPDHIKTIDIIPSIEELRCTSGPFLRPNKVTGAYNDSEHYIDVQFRLMKEDYVQPLRKGIQTFLKDSHDYITRRKRMPLEEMRLYTGVCIAGAEQIRGKFVYKLQLPEYYYKRVKWNKTKRLLPGNLILLTTVKNSFQISNTYFGIVFNRNVPELQNGTVTVTWDRRPPAYCTEEYLMFESEVYLEAYRHTLSTLKRLDLERFPMKKFIVDASHFVGFPRYLLRNKIRLKMENGSNIELPYNQLEWPPAEQFGLDDNQLRAFQAAVTREFTIIQGPPGTGKTFLGLKVAQTLLMNYAERFHFYSGPITVVCYTNHALDQFLEGILNYYEREGRPVKIARVGGRCKSEALEKYSLRNLKYQSNVREYFRTEKGEAWDSVRAYERQWSWKINEVTGLQNLQGIINFQRLSIVNKIGPKYPQGFWKALQNLNWFGIDDSSLEAEAFSEKSIAQIWFQLRCVGKNLASRNENIRFVDTVQRKNSVGAASSANVEDNEPDEDYDMDELMETRIQDTDEYFLEARSPKVNTNWQLIYVRATEGSCSTTCCEESCTRLQKSIYQNMEDLKLIRSIDLDDKKCLETIESHKNISLDPRFSELQRVIRSLGITNALTLKRAEEMLERKIKEEIKKLKILRRRGRLLAEIFRLYHGQLLDLPNVTELLKDICDKKEVYYDQLAMDQRWALYFAVVDRARYLISESLSEIQKRLAMAHNEVQRVEQLEDGWVLQECEVVGLTTTGAAKYNDLLRMMRSKIVIVEEAAEVFESHIVTCITQSCEQLILIGDHRQLRPSPTVYELAKTYHLDLSLFERMLNNNLHCYPLKTQHRMRPDISDLIVGTIYDELHNHESVKLYPNVQGLTKNVFFVTHTEKEASTEDSMSKSNMHEATFIGALCHHLIRQGYSPDRITILTMYMGQMFLLKKELSNILEMESCSKVRTTCVDNFQGEENDIILLSLVRSNSEGKIGFLGIENRVCVALSRARHGLYVIGNMVMMGKNKTWGHIIQKLEAKDFIGNALELECQIHGTRSKVQYAQDFLKVSPRGGCDKICDTVLPCSHKCKSVCHILDRDHKKYECMEPCLKLCGNQMHSCKFLCYQDCRRCHVPVERILNCELQHRKILPCFINVEQYRCVEAVEKALSCGHTELLACHIKIQDYKCNVKVTRKLPCGHEKELKCHVDPLTVKCGTFVSKTLPCGHDEMTECWRALGDIKCTTLVQILIENCQHERQVKCSEKDKPVICQRQCSTRLNCGHQCVMTCHVDDDPDHLLYQCKKDCSRNCVEDHRCKANHPCHQDCPPCTEIILRTLPCQHQANIKCFIDIKQYECLDKCQRLLFACGHVCPNKCSQPCGPCHIKVQKLAPCQHLLTVACSEDALKENCEQLVQPKSIPECGHEDVKVPCKYSEDSPRELVKYCQQPCGHVFTLTGELGCNHTCMGTCKSCFQGRIHVKCQSECGKQLVCGHRCEAPCSSICPPCQKPCLMKCAHIKCEKKCGETCSKCKEKCSWVCPHAECTRLCGELCDRDPCNEPCPEKLTCGHDCVGFCGEPCPPLCRECNSEELIEFNGLGKDARFVYLDCGHSIEVNELEKLMMNHKDFDESGHVPVELKVCPRCERPIKNCRRFGNLIRQAYQDVVAVKQRFTGNKNSSAMRDHWIFLLKQTNSIIQVFPLVYVRLRNILYAEVPQKNGKTSSVVPNKIKQISMRSLDFIANSAMKAAEELLDLQRKGRLVSPRRDKVIDTYCRTLLFMLDRNPLSLQEVKDFNQELDRAHSFKELKMRRLKPSCNWTEAVSVCLNAQEFVCSPLPFTPDRRDKFLNVLKELDDILECDLGVTVPERQKTFLAMGMNQGHWFKCRDGHIYAAGECGGILEGNPCSECKPATANHKKK